ncbi:hypothetical protein ACN6LI_006247 [Streptomyces violaceoruber]
MAAARPNRFGWFATLPMPDAAASAKEAERALVRLGADGVTLLTNNQGIYLGAAGQDTLWAEPGRARRRRVRPPRRPASTSGGEHTAVRRRLPPRHHASRVPARTQRRRPHAPEHPIHPQHAGGFVPYASHRKALTIASDTGRSPLVVLRYVE